MLITGECHHVTSFPFPLHYLFVQLEQQQRQNSPLGVRPLFFYLNIVSDKLCMACNVKPELQIAGHEI